MKISTFWLLPVAIVIWAAIPLHAKDYPHRDIQGIIMWGAGGGTDTVVRAIAPIAEPHLGKKIILVNKPGGTGAISTQYVYGQPSDGYTLLFGAENPQLYGVLALSKLDYKDFYPINILAYGVAVIVANKDMPWKSFKELVDDAQKRPGRIKMGSTGPGGIPFTVGAMLKTVAQIDVKTIPFDGDGPGLTAVMGGHADFFPTALGAAKEHIRAGRVKALAVVNATPVDGLEAVPAITEAFPGFEKYLPWGPFYGVFCKRDVPEEAKEKLTGAFRKAADTPQFQKFIADKGNLLMNISGDEADKFLKRYQSVTTWLLHDAGATKVSPEELGIPKP